MNIRVFTSLFVCVALFSCKPEPPKMALFKLLSSQDTGLDFSNTPVQNGEFNVLKYMYFFNGGGVAAGDFNNDGLIDLFFTANQTQNKLFLNLGGLRFKDVTEATGILDRTQRPKWSTGASVVDINNDGMLDIYVNGVGDYQGVKGQNELWICQKIENGVPVYEDLALRYGLDFQVFGTQATFLDYDLDGDLDLFQLNHSLHQNGTFGQRRQFVGKPHPLSGDKLLRNDGNLFIEVTQEAGIHSTVIGYGLGVVTGDVNNDGWPDIYVGNDFHENDYLYINQQDGTFREVLTEAMQHTSRFSMGVDIGDVNNDGWGDIVSLDMQPEDPEILRSSLGEDGFSQFQFKLGYGYNEQFAHNALQLNLGAARDGQNPCFSEISRFAGVFATDWSWASLFLDFDHDGHKDLFISNGIPRRMNDIDYANFMASDEKNDKWQYVDTLDLPDLKVVERMPRIKLPNKFYLNQTSDMSGVRFEDLGHKVAGNAPSYSNGAIYADLDNDGDLEIVTNNIEDQPFIYQNLSRENSQDDDRNYLKINLKGSDKNILAVGARVVVFKKDGQRIVNEYFPVRGYQSSMAGPLHIGIGDTTNVDSVLLIWPDRTYQRLDALRFNTTFDAVWKPGLPFFDFTKWPAGRPAAFPLVDATRVTGIDFKHEENPFVEFNRERLIPHMVSEEGPALAVGDVNGDGLEDVFFGSAKRERSALFLGMPGGKFSLKTPAAIVADSIFEDVDALFADLDGDGDQDLIVAAGGNEWKARDEAMKQRWYRNDGNGLFQRKDFPETYMTASCVSVADFDNDGLPDVFFGARALPWNYGLTPASVLLKNYGNARFEQVTEQVAPGLSAVGLVKNVAWADLDANGAPDLILALEWGPITVFYNKNGRLEHQELTTSYLGKKETLTGWWNFVLPHDLDGDGDLDILAGNTGKNSRLKPTAQQPVRMYVADFDKNDQIEQILTFYIQNKEVPFATHAEFNSQMPGLKKRFLYAKDFAKATAADLVGKEALSKAVKREANTFASMYFENKGNGQFETHDLPAQLQYSTLIAAQLADLNNDSRPEVLLAGNFHDCNIEMGRYDADYGHILRFTKDGKMEVHPLGDLKIKGQVRRIRAINIGGRRAFIFAKNNEAAQVIAVE